MLTYFFIALILSAASYLFPFAQVDGPQNFVLAQFLVSSMVLVKSRKRTYASAIGDTGARLVTPKAKDVAATTPNMPQAWSDTFLTDKPAECVEEYVGGMVHSVSIRLHECLRQASTLGGINLQGPLHAQTPIDVAKVERNANLNSYKDAWRSENCETSPRCQ